MLSAVLITSIWSPDNLYLITRQSLSDHPTISIWSPDNLYLITWQPLWSPDNPYPITLHLSDRLTSICSSDNLYMIIRHPLSDCLTTSIWSPGSLYLITWQPLSDHPATSICSPDNLYLITLQLLSDHLTTSICSPRLTRWVCSSMSTPVGTQQPVASLLCWPLPKLCGVWGTSSKARLDLGISCLPSFKG